MPGLTAPVGGVMPGLPETIKNSLIFGFES